MTQVRCLGGWLTALDRHPVGRGSPNMQAAMLQVHAAVKNPRGLARVVEEVAAGAWRMQVELSLALETMLWLQGRSTGHSQAMPLYMEALLAMPRNEVEAVVQRLRASCYTCTEWWAGWRARQDEWAATAAERASRNQRRGMYTGAGQRLGIL